MCKIKIKKLKLYLCSNDILCLLIDMKNCVMICLYLSKYKKNRGN